MKRLNKPNWQRQKERKKKIWFVALAALLLVPLGAASVYVLSKTISFSPVEVQGDRIFVRKGNNLQEALDKAKAGDTILLQAGTTFRGSFVLRKKSGNEFITIRTSAAMSQFTAENKRIDPKKYASVLPKIESNVKGSPAISTENGAHHYRFVGVEFMPTIEGYYDIVQIGSGEEKRIEDLPHHIEFDRVYMHGSEKYGQRRGLAANGRHIKIVNSHIDTIMRKGEESQAIATWSSDGPIIIENNYLEAGGENILFGGAYGPLELTPTNCIVRNNHLNKPLKWKGTEWVVKNLFEIKDGKNIKVQNNLMTNNWVMGQDGTAILFTVREDSGKAALIENVEFSNNIVRGSANAVNVYGAEGKGGRNLIIRNNLFADINSEKWGGNGFFLKSSNWNGLIIENNTIIQTGNITMAYGDPVNGFVFRNNIVRRNEYGFFGDSIGEGREAIDKFFPRAIVEKNIIIGGDVATYGQNNFYPTSIRQIGFVDMKNYKLGKNSPYKKRGVGGKQIGADVVASVGGNNQ